MTNVMRRRVYVRDVWETVRETAWTVHGIATQEDFARIRRTAQTRASAFSMVKQNLAGRAVRIVRLVRLAFCKRESEV